MSDAPRILVIGPTSKVGAHLVDQLVAEGVPTRTGQRRPEAAELRDGVAPVRLDFADPGTWGDALDGIDAAFVMWPPGAGAIQRSVIPLLEAAKARGVRRIVFLSVFGAGTLRFLPHAEVERWLGSSGLEHVILRAGYFMQNLSTMHRRDIVEHGEVFVPAGRGHLGLIDTRDVAAVALCGLLDPAPQRETYELTGSESLDFYRVAEMFSAALDRPIIYREPSLWSFVRRWRTREIGAGMIAFMTLEYAFTRLDRSGRTTADVERVLGRPPISLRRFIEDHRGCWGAEPSAYQLSR